MLIEDIPVLRFGDADTLQVRKHEVEQALGPDDVAIGVKYSGINFADIQMRIGLYPEAPPKPFVPGYEVSGIVEAVGSNVQHFNVGQQVVAGTYFGGYTSRIVVPAFQVFALPKTLTLEQGAATPVNFFTAWSCLFEMARVKEGERVLIEPGTGGVGTLAIQMAKHAGCEVTALTTSPSKKDYIRSLGATAYTRDEFYADASLRDFKMVLNASGGNSIKEHMARLDLTGCVVCIGVNSAVKNGKRNLLRAAWTVVTSPLLPVLTLLNKNQGVFGFNGLTMMKNAKWVANLTQKLAAIDAMKLQPHVDQVFPAADVAKAHRHLESKGAKGKVLLGW